MRTLACIAVAAIACAAGQSSFGQNTIGPADAVTEAKSDQPMAAVVTPETLDRELAALRSYLVGEFHSAAVGERPAMTLRCAPIAIDKVERAFLFELARDDAAADPFRLFVVHPYVRRGKIRLRTFEFFAGSGLTAALAGLSVAPDALPKLSSDAIAPSMDIPMFGLRGSGRDWKFLGQTEHSFPTLIGRATEVTASFKVDDGKISLSDAGFDENGRQVWGGPPDKYDEFLRTAPERRVVRQEGVTVVTTRTAEPDAPRHEPGSEITIHFTHWTSTGLRIQSSRDAGREPVKVRVPGAPLPALDKALSGIAKGERRKIVIPPDLAYGDRGRGTVPPNSTLIYDIECLAVNNTPAPPPPPAPAPGANPHAAPPAAPAPPNDAPIGTPSTGGTPETPR